MTTAGQRKSGALDALIERYDGEVIDVPGGDARVRLVERGGREWDARLSGSGARLEPAKGQADAVLSASPATWRAIAEDVRGGMTAFRAGRLQVRGSLHLGVGFLAATSAIEGPGRLRFESIPTSAGRISTLAAGEGEPLVCIHGLGGTKASFLPTVAALAESRRVIAMDLPGFGESHKPVGAPYDAAFFARSVFALLDSLGLDHADLAGNSMGGRVAIECGLTDHARARRLVLLSPSLAWLRDRPWAPFLKLVRPELGLLQPAPRRVVDSIVRRVVPGARDGWSAAGVDDFLRVYLTPRGRAAFYAAARNIYLERPDGDDGFWPRLRGLSADSLFVWGRNDRLVPISFMRHVEEALPRARHVELDCGHVPQLERPDETHAAMRDFLGV
ncbi:MAG TPA: alpha/beta fold hydrolase [Thermoleophilaceae bacterium]|nr:alpha/beta fold hydrolase [Thermoleophilaceae bacterium]